MIKDTLLPPVFFLTRGRWRPFLCRVLFVIRWQLKSIKQFKHVNIVIQRWKRSLRCSGFQVKETRARAETRDYQGKRVNLPYKRGVLGFSVLRIWPMFGSVFATWKLHFFGFGVFHGLRVFSNLVFDFWFWWQFFGFFCPVHFTVFLVLPRKLHPAVALKPVTVIQRTIYIAFHPFF